MIAGAVVGMIGIRPTIAAMNAGKDIALANKETLVTAGHIIMSLAKEKHVRILPVDSEHSAIFQSLNGETGNKIHKILLTASGGPFRGWTREQMKGVQVEDALKHPNWTMGRKITIDSSTMVNKGLEVMEARWLFGVEMDQVQVVVQPQSVIHSMVEYEDGAVIAQLGTPDMKLPIQYALYYPERRFLAGDRLDFAKLAQITFEAPDFENFHGLSLAYKAGRRGGTLPTVFNAANERAVQKFLDREIGYLTITDMIEAAMEHHTVKENPTVEEILAAEQARDLTEDKEVIVIPSTNIPQGIAAMINFMPGQSVDENTAQMTEEMKNVKSGQVTYAVRDTQMDGKDIKQGDYMGIADKKIVAVEKGLQEVTLELVKGMLDDESELVSLYYGADVTEKDAEAVADLILKDHDDLEVEVQYGGQPVYSYFVSVE